MQEKPHAHGLEDPVFFARAVILPREGHDGNADGVVDWPENAVQLPEDRPGRDGVGAEHVDGLLDIDVRDVIEHAGNAGGKADDEHALEQPRVRTDFLELEMIVPVCTPERVKDEPRTDDLRKTRRNRRARDLQLEDGDKKKVQNGVHDRADDEEQKGPLRVSERAEDAASHVVDHGGDHARKVPDEVVLRVLQRIFRRIERGKKQGRDGCAKKRRERAHHDGQKHRRMHGPAHLLVLLRARVLRDDDGSAG